LIDDVGNSFAAKRTYKR